MSEDITKRIYFNSVNIDEEVYRAILTASDGKEVDEQERVFDIYTRNYVGSLIADDELWAKIPEDSVWTEDWFSPSGGVAHFTVRTKTAPLYSFERVDEKFLAMVRGDDSTLSQLPLYFEPDANDIPF